MGKIYLTDEAEEILEKYPKHKLKVFKTQEFKIADAKAVINESYILDKEGKIIAIISKIFNIEAQNALLKILEEPPSGIEFLIFTLNKNTLLPTICSRMQIINTIKRKAHISLKLDLKNLTLSKIYEFLRPLESSSRIQAQETIQSLLQSIQENQIKLSEQELELFDTAMKAAHHYEKLHIAILPILLSLSNR